MFRTIILSMGIYAAILGAECMVIERAIIVSKNDSVAEGAMNTDNSYTTREFVPPEWAPWTLLSGGIIVALYTVTIPKRASG